jgi:glycosyltransferase involved in cell wall biosynthesis
MSCRGWSSDAYWAARACRELGRQGHTTALWCRRGTERRVIERARAEGVGDIQTLSLGSGMRPADDVRDIRRISAELAHVDVVHAHRGKEHWLAAIANRVSLTPRPLVRTRHIVLAVRPHAANRWLYRRATACVVTVTEAIRRQYVASGLLGPDRVIAIPGGADTDRFRPGIGATGARERLGATDREVLVGMIGGLRVMKGHGVVVDALARLAAAGIRPRVAFVGQGPMRAAIEASIAKSGLEGQVRLTGPSDDVPAVLAALDVALYVPLESDGMSRVLFEYLAAGRPVVASRVGVVPEALRDGDDALLVPAADAPALVRALRLLLASPEVRGRLGAAARRLVETRYSGACVARRLADLYLSVS